MPPHCGSVRQDLRTPKMSSRTRRRYAHQIRRLTVSLTALAFWLREPGVGEIRSVPLPEPGPDDVLVRTVCTAISRGTEGLVFQGRVPASQYRTMRAPF